MASRGMIVSPVPIALPGIVEATTYTIQNVGVQEMRISVGAAADNIGFVLPPGGYAYASTGAGEHIFVWSSPGTRVIYEASAHIRLG